MAKTDFTFAANVDGASSNTSLAFSQYAYLAHSTAPAANGATTAAQGNLVRHSDLSNPLASSIGGNLCRGWSSRSTNGATQNDAGVVVALVTSAAGGSSYPVTDTPSNGTLISFSMRSFLRLEAEVFVSASVGNNTIAGTNVGFMFKTEDFSGYQGNDLMQYYTTGLSPKHGYCVSLGTGKLTGDTGHPAYMARGGAPRLQISANNHSNPTAGSNHFITQATNIEYQRDTWYHVRADLIPAVSKDTINVYTAPISGAGSAAVEGLGSETWTLVATKEISATDDAYVPWGNGTYDKCGYFAGCYNGSSRTSGGKVVPLIDKFQFLTKDIS